MDDEPRRDASHMVSKSKSGEKASVTEPEEERLDRVLRRTTWHLLALTPVGVKPRGGDEGDNRSPAWSAPILTKQRWLLKGAPQRDSSRCISFSKPATDETRLQIPSRGPEEEAELGPAAPLQSFSY